MGSRANSAPVREEAKPSAKRPTPTARREPDRFARFDGFDVGEAVDRLGNRGVLRLLQAQARLEHGAHDEDPAEAQAERAAVASADEPSTASMAKRVGANLDEVRLHDDAEAHELAAGLHAQAFTVGRDIYFAHGRYAPHTHEGRHLVAHELAHVAQQQQSGPRVQRRDDDAPPPYVANLQPGIESRVDSLVRVLARDRGTRDALDARYGGTPYRDDAVIDIPGVDYSANVDWSKLDQPRGRFHIGGRLAGGYRLVTYSQSRHMVVIAREQQAYALDDATFYDLFGRMLPRFVEEIEWPARLVHERPELILAFKLYRMLCPWPPLDVREIPASIAFFALPLLGLEGGGGAPEAPLAGWESEGVAAFELENLGGAEAAGLPEAVGGQEVANGVNAVLRGRAPLDTLTQSQRASAADFYRATAERVVGTKAAAARAFNLERANYLLGRTSTPPGTLPEFMQRTGAK